jgi:hypothetical protein
MKKEDYRALTGFLRENWQSKRVFTIFATNAIAPDVWSSGNDNVIDPETVEFVTDAGYDMYWDVRGDGIIPFEKVNASLKERFGRDDVNIWYVPCIMNYRGNKDEAYAIAHTNAMYEFLKQEKNPGGLLCYAYAIEDHDGEVCNIGFCEMRERSEAPWTALENRLLKIGKEIVG